MADQSMVDVVLPEQARNVVDDESKALELESGNLRKATSSVRDMEDTRTKSFVILVAITAALGGLVFGFDIGGAGATFVMKGFQEHFGWECPVDEPDCVPASQNQIDVDQGLINGLFGTGAAFGALFAPTIFNGFGSSARANLAQDRAS